MIREKAQAASIARPKVPMRWGGADCLVVALKRGNARGAKGAGHRHWVGSTGNGRNPTINGRRQPSRGGTSRMMREYHVRICEGLGVKFPGPTRHGHDSAAIPERQSVPSSQVGALPQISLRQDSRLPYLHPNWHYRSWLATVSLGGISESGLALVRIVAPNHSSRHPAIGTCCRKGDAGYASRFSRELLKK